MRKSKLITFFSAVILGSILISGEAVSADCEFAKIRGSDTREDDEFGHSVEVWSDHVIVGAPFNDNDGGLYDNPGSAYIFRFDGARWGQVAKLQASDSSDGDEFGYSVGIYGDTAIAGTPWDDDIDNGCGAVYIFRFNGSSWEQEAKLLASDGGFYEQFGYAVGIWGDTAVVTKSPSYTRGAAYIFQFNGSNWVQEAKLVASDGVVSDTFGRSAGISGDTVIIGAPLDDDNGDNSGSAYIFRYNGSSWVQVKLLASDGAEDDHFGWSVEISGDTAIVGAEGDGSYGSAYIFRFNGSSWEEEAKLLKGWSVDISGDTAIIGPGGSFSYIFRFNGSSWVEERTLRASDGESGDRFGCSVGIFGDKAVVGARLYDGPYNSDDSGAAYIFDFNLIGGDVDKDYDVDIIDLGLFAEYWLEDDCNSCTCEPADCTGDGKVNFGDFAIMAENWLAGGAISHWKFDEGSGTTAYDSEGDNDGTIYGAVWTTGEVGGALDFDGSDDYVEVADDNSLDMYNHMTIAAWVKPENVSETYCIAGKQPSGTASDGYPGNYVFMIAAGSLRLCHQTGPGESDICYEATSSVSADIWQHVAVTLKKGNANIVSFYIDGAPAGVSLKKGEPFGIINDEPVRIGKLKNGEFQFNGAIDDVRIYNKVLTTSEIERVYLEGL